jgi:hypothetical protein
LVRGGRCHLLGLRCAEDDRQRRGRQRGSRAPSRAASLRIDGAVSPNTTHAGLARRGRKRQSAPSRALRNPLPTLEFAQEEQRDQARTLARWREEIASAARVVAYRADVTSR